MGDKMTYVNVKRVLDKLDARIKEVSTCCNIHKEPFMRGLACGMVNAQQFIFEAKAEEASDYSAKYIIKEVTVYNDTSYHVMCHYPTTEPDVHVMGFKFRENAELFCEALNAENEFRATNIRSIKGGNV